MTPRLVLLLVLFLPGAARAGVGDNPPVFTDGFENAESLADLFPLDGSRWMNFGITGEGSTLELDRGRAHTGEQSLRCHASAYDGVTASKAYIANGFLRFVEGDRAWFEMWVWVQGATPDLFLWDLEAPGTCTTQDDCPEAGDGTICSSPGRRVYLENSEGTPIRSDLGKWCTGEDFTQEPGRAVAFAPDRWTRLRVFIGLSSGPDGIMLVWQDDRLVLVGSGRTLPRDDSVYERLQVGVTANGSTEQPATLFLDDVSIWSEPPAWWSAVFDLDAGGDADIEDLYDIHSRGVDLNGDGLADHADAALLEAVLRWDELLVIRRSRHPPTE